MLTTSEAWDWKFFSLIRIIRLKNYVYLKYAVSGAHHLEPATTPYSCHGVFTDRSIFSLNLSRIQIPTGTSVTNCNHEHGLMLTCRNDVDMFTWGRIVLSLPKRVHISRNWPFSPEKYLKIEWFVKMAVSLAYYGSRRLPVMGSWLCLRACLHGGRVPRLTELLGEG